MENKAIAVSILSEASKQVDGGRDIHGPVSDSYAMIAQMWEVYLRHSNYKRHGNPPAGSLHIDALDVLELMSILKKCRGVYSPVVNRENFVDDVGYTALAGMVATAIPAQAILPPQEPLDQEISNIARTFKPRREVHE